MVPKGQLSVKDNIQVYFFGATKNWCTASLRALVFLGNDQQCHDYMLLI